MNTPATRMISVKVNASSCTLENACDNVEAIVAVLKEHGFSGHVQKMASNIFIETALNVFKHNIGEMIAEAGYRVDIDIAAKSCRLTHSGYILPKQKERMLRYFNKAQGMTRDEIVLWLASDQGFDYPTVTGDISSGSGIRTQFVDAEGRPELMFDSNDTLLVTRRNGQKQFAEKFTLTMDIAKGHELPRNENLQHPMLLGRTHSDSDRTVCFFL